MRKSSPFLDSARALVAALALGACGLQGPALEQADDGGLGGGGEGGGSDTQACTDVLAIESSSTQLAEFSAAIANEVAIACHAIATDFLLDPGPLPLPTANADVAQLCDVAMAGIQAKVMSVGSVSVAFAPPECVEDEAAADNCLATCGSSTTCERACAVERELRASCPQPEVRVYVMGTVSTAYVSSLEEHLPVLIQVHARSQHALPSVHGLLAALDAMNPDDLSPLCGDALTAATDAAAAGAHDSEATRVTAASVLHVLGID